MPESTKKPINLAQMFPQFEDIRDPKLKQAVSDIWHELWARSPWDDVDKVPAGHAIPSPNLPHCRCILDMALAAADAIEKHHGQKVDRDVLIAAGILQDASKVVEYSPRPDGTADFSEQARLYPHSFWTAYYGVQKGLPEAVIHILFTHSPNWPRFPLSLEGKLLYYADVIDILTITKDPWRKEVFVTRPSPYA